MGTRVTPAPILSAPILLPLWLSVAKGGSQKLQFVGWWVDVQTDAEPGRGALTTSRHPL